MSEKRDARRAAARAKAAARARAEVAAASERAEAAAEQATERDVVPWLRQLRFRDDEVRRAAAHCETIPDATLEERVRAALSFLGPRPRSQHVRPVAGRVGTAV